MRRRSIGLILSVTVCAAVLAVIGPATAAPGDLDPSFDGDGIVELPGGGDRGPFVAPDGDIFVLQSFTAHRLNPDGSLDTRISLEKPSGSPWYFEAAELYPGSETGILGLIRMAGARPTIGVARWHLDGSLDRSFGDGGFFEIPKIIERYDGHGWSMTGGELEVDDDGRILVIARKAAADLIRLLANGSPDPSFGSGGFVTLGRGVDIEEAGESSTYYRHHLSGLSLAPDGKIIVGGYMTPMHRWAGVPRVTWLKRLLEDGLPDPTFGSAGTAVLSDVMDVLDTAVGADGIFVSLSLDHRDQVVRLDDDGSMAHQYARGLNGTFAAANGAVYVSHPDTWPYGDVAGPRRLLAEGVDPAFTPSGSFGSLALQEDGKLLALNGPQLVRVLTSDSGADPDPTSSPSPSPTPSPTSVELNGFVRDRDAQSAIAGASVECDGGYSGTTSDWGYYVISLPPGTYFCTASATGYHSDKDRFSVDQDGTAHDFELRAHR